MSNACPRGSLTGFSLHKFSGIRSRDYSEALSGKSSIPIFADPKDPHHFALSGSKYEPSSFETFITKLGLLNERNG